MKKSNIAVGGISDISKENDLTVENADRLRKRVEYEDHLLNSRTTIILTINGLMAVAASLPIPDAVRLALAGVIIFVNLLWIPCALEAHGYIKVLSLRLKNSSATPIDGRIRQDFLAKKRRVGTTKLMSIIIPMLLLVGWIVAVVLLIWTLNKGIHVID